MAGTDKLRKQIINGLNENEIKKVGKRIFMSLKKKSEENIFYTSLTLNFIFSII